MKTRSKILIVDDNDENLSVLGNLLVNNNFIVQVAQSGEQAVKIAEKKSPDLILLDISMPGLSGYDVCKILKLDEKTSDIPIIFLTAHTEIMDVVKGFKFGAIDYITKPFNEAVLLSRVRTHLELKLSREKLKNTNKELKTTNATKDRFFSILAHDLRSPFSSFLGLTEIAIKELEKDNIVKAKESLQSVYNSAQKTFELLTNLLQWSRIQSGKIEFNPQFINVQHMLIESVDLLKASYTEKEIDINTNVDPKLIIQVDIYMFQTIVRNLLSNAIKFTHKKGKIGIIATETEDDMVKFIVEDNGIGISTENIEKLFQIDRSFSTLGTNNEAGTGLGLTLCKDFVEKHGGAIWVESEINKGSKFIFTIKRKHQK